LGGRIDFFSMMVIGIDLIDVAKVNIGNMLPAILYALSGLF
jgi:uncharacterized membrane protein YqgA involved in biofilm formation